MRINESNERKIVDIHSIGIGEVFLYGQAFFIKTEPMDVTFKDGSTYNNVVGINLESGSLFYLTNFDSNETVSVKHVNATLHVNENSD